MTRPMCWAFWSVHVYDHGWLRKVNADDYTDAGSLPWLHEWDVLTSGDP